MEITTLLKSGIFLIAILGLLIFIFFYSSKKRKLKAETKISKKDVKQVDKAINTDLNHLRSEIRKQKTSTTELKLLLDLVLKHHGVIHRKLGVRSHPDFDIYSEIIIVLCRHAHTDKSLIIGFDKELSRLNPEYKREINDALTKGLNSRGA